MPRIRLVEQERYEFHCVVTLHPRDINYGGHLGNDSLVSLLTTARVYLFSELGGGELDLGDHRTGVIMSDLAVNYKAEAYMLDELALDTHAGEFSRTGFRFFYRVSRDDTLIALAETGMVTFDYRSRKVVPVPEIFLKALSAKKERAENLRS